MSALSQNERLQQAIANLREKQELQGELVGEQFRDLRRQLKPSNLVKAMMDDVIGSPDVREGMVDMALGLTTGMIAKKVVTGNSNNVVTQLIGSAVEMIVAREVSQHSEGLKNLGKSLFQRLF